jgi:hypothetical protein
MSGNTTWFGVQYPSSSDYVKDGATAIQTVATGFDSAVAIPTYNAQTGTTYTFVLADTSKTVTASNAASSTYTIPPQSSVVWVAGTTLNVTNLGAGVVTFAGGVGVTVTNTTNTLSQYQSAQLIRTGSNAWTVLPASGIATSPGLTLISNTTLTAVSSQSFNNVFSATYDNYKIILNIDTAATNPTVNMRLRVGGVDNSASNYWNNRIIGQSTTVQSQGATSAGTSFTSFGEFESGAASFAYDIFCPFKTEISRIVGTGEFRYTSFYQHTQIKTGQTTVTTSYDGFSLIMTAGTITGSVKIYGYNQ